MQFPATIPFQKHFFCMAARANLATRALLIRGTVMGGDTCDGLWCLFPPKEAKSASSNRPLGDVFLANVTEGAATPTRIYLSLLGEAASRASEKQREKFDGGNGFFANSFPPLFISEKEGRREGGKLKEILLLSVTLYHANTNFWEGENVIVVNQQKYIADTIGGSLRLLTISPVTAESAGL